MAFSAAHSHRLVGRYRSETMFPHMGGYEQRAEISAPGVMWGHIPLQGSNSVTPTQHDVVFRRTQGSAPTKDSAEPKIEISFDRKMYFDNDVLPATITMKTSHELLYPNAMVLLLCRFESLLILSTPDRPRDRMATLYSYRRPIASHGDLFVPVGTTSLTIEFYIPPNTPASFTSKWGSIRWEVRLLHANEKGGFSTLAKAVFSKGSSYHSLPGYIPTAQAERRPLLSRTHVRVEAKLSKDVYSAGEAVEVQLVMHCTGKKMPITGVTARVHQVISAVKSNRVLLSRQYIIDAAKLKRSSWLYDGSRTEEGILVEKRFSLLPGNSEKPSWAHQMQKGSAKRVLCPSLLAVTRKAECMVQYCIMIHVKVAGASDMCLRVPFHIQTPIDTVEETRRRDVTIFPSTDEPPEYEKCSYLSTPSYTCLRRQSADSFFHSYKIPQYEELECDDPSPPRKQSLVGAVSRLLSRQYSAPASRSHSAQRTNSAWQGTGSINSLNDVPGEPSCDNAQPLDVVSGQCGTRSWSWAGRRVSHPQAATVRMTSFPEEDTPRPSEIQELMSAI